MRLERGVISPLPPFIIRSTRAFERRQLPLPLSLSVHGETKSRAKEFYRVFASS